MFFSFFVLDILVNYVGGAHLVKICTKLNIVQLSQRDIYRQMDGWMDEWMEGGREEEGRDEWMDGLIDLEREREMNR